MTSDESLISGSIVFSILRATKWETPMKIIGDETRSGASKVRIAHTANRKKFSAVFKMDDVNAEKFNYWFEHTNLNGFNHFFLPRIDSSRSNQYGVYRFAPNSTMSWNNTAGKILEVSVELEELG